MTECRTSDLIFVPSWKRWIIIFCLSFQRTVSICWNVKILVMSPTLFPGLYPGSQSVTLSVPFQSVLSCPFHMDWGIAYFKLLTGKKRRELAYLFLPARTFRLFAMMINYQNKFFGVGLRACASLSVLLPSISDYLPIFAAKTIVVWLLKNK